MTDYSYWSGKLAGQDPDPPADRTLLPLGFWRLRNGEPLAVWLEDDRRHALVGFRAKRRMMRTPEMERVAEQGAFGHAVTEAAYREAFAAGLWADDPPPADSRSGPYATIGIGDNLPTDPFERLRLELDGELENSAPLLKAPIADQATADKLATWSRRVGQLLKAADEEHEIEKRPILDAGKRIDDKWRGLRSDARSLVDRLKAHVGIWLRKLDREAAEARRKAEEEAAALREQAAAERAPVEAAELVDQAEAIELAAAKAPKPIAGRPNMRVSLRKVRTAKIVDYDRAVAALKSHPDMRALVQTLADRAVRAGVAVDGVEVEEVDKPI